MKNRTMIPLIVCAVLIAGAVARAEGLEQEAGIRLLVGVPSGDFQDHVEDPGFGLALHYGLRPAPQLTMGIGGDVMTYGSESRDMQLPLADDFDLTTSNNLADLFVFGQYRLLQGNVQPYGEARFGYRYLWTESSLENDGWWGGSIASKTNYDDFASFWAVGGGVQFRVYEPKRDSSKPSVWIDFKVMYGKGNTAEYLVEGALDVVDDEPVYTASESETDLTTWEMGVVLTF